MVLAANTAYGAVAGGQTKQPELPGAMGLKKLLRRNRGVRWCCVAAWHACIRAQETACGGVYE